MSMRLKPVRKLRAALHAAACGLAMFTAAAAHAQPANDNCVTATAVTPAQLPFMDSVSLSGATTDPDTSCNDGSLGQRFGVWYSFAPSSAGHLRFADLGLLDLVVEVYTGPDCASLTPIKCTDAEDFVIPVTPGTTYWFLVGPWSSSTTTPTSGLEILMEAVTPPANDTCAGATVLTDGAAISDPIVNAVDEEDNTCNGTFNTSAPHALWYTFTPTMSGNYRFADTGTQNVNIVHYSGACPVGLGSPDSCLDGEDNIYALSAGVQYWWQVSQQSVLDAFNTAVNYEIAFNVVAPPANDTCATAAVISPSTTPITIDARTADADSPPLCDTGTFTVWYTFTPSVSGRVAFAETSSADTTHAIYSGACGALTPVGTCQTAESSSSINVTGGTQYWLQVGFDPTTGAPAVAYTFTLDVLVPPANDLCANAISLTSLPITEVADARAATATGDPSHGTCDTATGFSVWYSYTPSANGSLRVNETSTADVVIAAYTGGCGAPVNAAPSYSCSTADLVLLPMTSGTSYLVRVASSSDITAPTVPFNIDFEFIPAPANDTCATATAVSSFPFSDTLDVRGAGVDQPISCDSSTVTGGARFGVWYTLTPATNGSLTIGEAGTFDIALAVFTGSCAGLTQVHCSDPDPTTFAVVGGTQYWIQVNVWSPTAFPTTDWTINLEFLGPPDNDFCETAEALSLSGGTATADARAAEPDQDVGCDTPAQATAGVWFSITTMAEGGLLVLDETSTASVVWSLYSGPCESLSLVICDTESTTDSFQLAANTSYKLLVSNNSASLPGAAYSFSYTFTPATGACCNGTSCSIQTLSACTGAMGTYIGDNASCTGGPQAVNAGPILIEDFVTTTGTLSVADPITVSSVEIRMTITHTWVGDVAIAITAPDGTTTASLVEGANITPCSTAPFTSDGDDVVGNFVFSDAGTTTLMAAALAIEPDGVIPPGTYQASDCTGTPISLNTTFAGVQGQGNWTLSTFDLEGGIEGTVTNVELVLNGGTTPPCEGGETPCDQADFDGSGTVDATDIFIFLDAWFAQNGQSGPNLSADTDGSGTVDATDIFIYLDLWFANNGMTC